MASRRLRIKPTANVPMRRGKCNTDERIDEKDENAEKVSLTKSDQAEVSGLEKENVCDRMSCDDNSQNDVLCALSVSAAQTSESHKEISNNSENSNSEADVRVKRHEYSSGSKNLLSCSSTVQETNRTKVPPGLMRKRMKPEVSISAVSGRSRNVNKNPDGNSESVLVHKNDSKISCEEMAQQNVERCNNFSENDSARASCSPKVDMDAPFLSGKDIGVGVPGITQIIPTGTAIRPQHDSGVSMSASMAGNGEAPQSLPEPDLPSEGAGVGNLHLLSKPSSSRATVVQRSKFLKPSPCIMDSNRNRKFAGSGASNSESEDESGKTCSLPVNSTAKLRTECNVPKSMRHVPYQEDKAESLKHGYGISASESDDESKKGLSDASTVTPPLRKVMESSRGKFARPTPRFMEASVRRNSSASESEDEVRRTYSLASTISPPKRSSDVTCEEPAVDTCYDKTFSEEMEKKPLRIRRAPSSSMQRMAKARHEFQVKFGKERPDRSRLTMFDLIFYNPTTNPMKSGGSDSSKNVPKGDSEQIIEERLAEERVDEPTQENEEVNNETVVEAEDEDVALPVPQVKVGPDGQIILDEKSLVIETTGAKKNREDLANSAVIVDCGSGSTGYGTYSRRNKKTKDWSREETLKFYKALNTIGTDFLLMQSLFPKRSRKDLKIKFKKEDRINRFLVEKALRNPRDFDITELEKDLEKEEDREREKTLKKLVPKPVPRKRKKYPKKGNEKKSFFLTSMDSSDIGEFVREKNKPGRKKGDKNSSTTEIKKPCKNSKMKSKKFISSSSSSSSSDDENDESTYKELKFIANDEGTETLQSEVSDDDMAELEYLSKPQKPTRSGRIPQPKKMHPDDNSICRRGEVKSKMLVTTKKSSKTCAENQSQPLEDLTNVEPGSLVVLATQSPTNPAHHIYKVFMVAPNSGCVPVSSPASLNMPLPLLNTVTSSMESGACSQQSSDTNMVTEK